MTDAPAPMLVFGGTGRIGARVVARLAQAGCAVRCVVRDPARAAATLPAGVAAVRGDLADPASLRGLARDGDAVFVASPVAPDLADAQCAAIDAVRARASRIVKLSGSTWTQDPSAPTTSGRAHAAIEAALRDCGLPAAAVRPGVFTEGFLQAGLARARSGDTLALPIGSARVAFAAPDDIAAVCAALLLRSPAVHGVVEVGVPEAVDGVRLAHVAGALTGRALRYQPVPVDAVLAARRAALPDFDLEHLRQMLEAIAAGRAARPAASPEPVTGLPMSSIEAALSALLAPGDRP